MPEPSLKQPCVREVALSEEKLTPRETLAAGPTALKDCRRNLALRLKRSLSPIFTALTGLALHAFWHQAPAIRTHAVANVLCPTARVRLRLATRRPAACWRCPAGSWPADGFASNEVCRFVGICGSANLCADLLVAGQRVLTLLAQASRRIAGPSESPQHHGLKCPGPATPQAHILATGFHRAVTSAAFDRAEPLLRLIVHDLESTANAQLAADERVAALRRLAQLKKHTRPQQDSFTDSVGHVPMPAGSYHLPGPHARYTVQVMLDYVHQHYQRPMALRELAAELGMNPNYLSDLFHKVTGVPFHQYLEQRRMTKAQGLLCRPGTCVSEVAHAVGYASSNHFRHVFKLNTGSSPGAWAQKSTLGSPEESA